MQFSEWRCVSVGADCFSLSFRFNFHVLNHPGWLKVSPLTRYAPGSSPARSPPAAAGPGPGHSQTLKPGPCTPEPSAKPPPPSGVEGAPVGGKAPMKEVEEEKPAAAPDTGGQRELMESARQIYSEHNYCRLPV